MIQKPPYALSQIANWQLDTQNSDVELPPLQRGFVWRVEQIEELWDSLLRGFPVGSFLLSKSDDEKLFLLDGQQRATSIAIGYYDPWETSENGFWSLKNKYKVPVIWIDLAPKEKTATQKFVLRVVTQSHPWGYQINHDKKLSVPDRRKALNIFRGNPENESVGYITLSKLNVFPYDSDLPVPLSFLIKSISETNNISSENSNEWKNKLISLCERHLPIQHIKTKRNQGNYIEQLKSLLYSIEFDNNIFSAIRQISQIKIPGIIVEKGILKSEDEQTGEDPTLFVRLNSSGTRIAGEELIYSIYKASFPEAKGLVESIGASFVAPSLVISLVSRLAYSELIGGLYPSPISVNDFRKRIQDDAFKNKLREYIGDTTDEESDVYSPAKEMFKCALDILLSKDEIATPPVLVKNIVKSSPELFLMLLHWARLKKGTIITGSEKKRALAAITSLSWFGRDTPRYVRAIWGNINSDNFWTKEVLGIPYQQKRDYIMYPLIQPSILREYLMQEVVEGKKLSQDLYPGSENSIYKQYEHILKVETERADGESANEAAIRDIWNNFRNKLHKNKQMLLFAQRKYINESFGDFNQMEDLQDTNAPWDWDHIYPDSWVYLKKNINRNTRHWNSSIGNLRAISLEENRSESNRLSPRGRLFDLKEKIDVREQSFIKYKDCDSKKNDWTHWEQIEIRINDGDDKMISTHLTAVVTRLCNIYDDWYTTLDVGELFAFETN